MKKTTFIFLFALIGFGILFSGCEKKSSEGLTLKEGVLKVGVEIGYPPMEYYAEDGVSPIGFDISMAKALAEKMGLEVEFIDTAWAGIFAGVDTDKYDCIISSVTITEARLMQHNFSKPYIQNTLAIVVKKDSDFSFIESPLDLAGLEVAYQEDTTSDHYIAELSEREGFSFTPRAYDKVMNCFDDLSLDRVNVIITDLLVAYEYLARAENLEIVWMGGDEEFGICMKKDNDALTEAVDAALDELFSEGTILQISNEIFGMDLVSALR